MSNTLKSFGACLVVVIIGSIIGSALGLDNVSTAYGFLVGMVWCYVYERFEDKGHGNVSQVQIVKDGQTIHIQANGDINVRS